MSEYLTMDDADFSGKTVLVRVDFNSPVDPETKRIIDDTRIRAHSETIRELSEKGAKVVILAHQGRPGDPDFIPLKQHAKILGKILGKPVKYVQDVFGEEAKREIRELKFGEILVLENVRNFARETDEKSAEEHAQSELVKNLAPLADVFVSDGFSVAHRSQASVVGFTPLLTSVAGRMMEKELKALSEAMEAPEKPCIFILGGAKAEKCIDIVRYVLDNNIADHVLTGGLVGHVVLEAEGVDIGKPSMKFLEKKGLADLIPKMKEIVEKYPGRIDVPSDVAVEIEGKRKEIEVSKLPVVHPIYDIGSKTVEEYGKIIGRAKSIVLSGPMGVYERDEFREGTKGVFTSIAESRAFKLAGGGDTIAALEKLGLHDRMSYVSTAGGAFIEYLMGKKLPAVEALKEAAKRTA
ncbi:MAG: phosphoglycerate kinase [Candidatus Bathyarchaeota archaeon]|nr:phosphoglycerate kinase [Candidatus Bathyarchaeota archaeon]